MARRRVAGVDERLALPIEPQADRPVIDVDRGKADDLDAVVIVDSVDLAVVEFVAFNFGADRRQQADAGFRIPPVRRFLRVDEVLHPVLGIKPDGPYTTSGFVRPPAQLPIQMFGKSPT